MPVAWSQRFAGSSIMARWLPPAFNNSLSTPNDRWCDRSALCLAEPHVDTSEGACGHSDGVLAQRRAVAQCLRVESFMDELAAAAKQDPVDYRRALLDKARVQSRSRARRGEGRLGQPLPQRTSRGRVLQFVFGTYMAPVLLRPPPPVRP